MSTTIRDDDYDGPTFEKLAHHKHLRRPRLHMPLMGMVAGRRPVTKSPTAREKRAQQEREEVARDRQARLLEQALADLRRHYDRRRAA